MWHDPWGWGGMWFGPIFPLIIIAIIIWAVVTFVNNTRKHDRQNSHLQKETALDILKKRYAKGEISKEEFEQMKKDLE
jgi:putative membrane protein